MHDTDATFQPPEVRSTIVEKSLKSFLNDQEALPVCGSKYLNIKHQYCNTFFLLLLTVIGPVINFLNGPHSFFSNIFTTKNG